MSNHLRCSTLWPSIAALMAGVFVTGCDAVLGDRRTATESMDSVAIDSIARVDSARAADSAAAVERRAPSRRSTARTTRRGTTPAGQTAPAAPSRPDSARRDTAAPVPAAARAASAGIAPRVDLQRIVGAQEQHIANVGRYASRTSALGLRYLPATGVSLAITTASDSGWTGRATRVGWTGSCVVWVGQVDPKPRTETHGLSSPTSGVAICDP